MTVNRTTLLDLPLPVTGTESGTWGDTTNNGLTQYMDIAIAGMSNLTSANFTTGALTIETTEGNSSATNISATSAQYAGFRVTSLAQNSTITVGNTGTSPARSYRLINADATYTLTFKATGQTGITLQPGQTAVVAFNGTDYVIVGMAGAGTATDNAVVRFDGTTGKLVQNSVVTIADSTGDISGVGQLNATTVDTTNIEVTNIKAKDGTAAATIADATGVVSITANPVLSGGTANGVLYLNGSKVATSGSALTFDGTTLFVGAGTASTYTEVNIQGASTANYGPYQAWVSGGTKILEIANYGRIQGGTSTNSFITTVGALDMVFGTNRTEQMRLTSTGLGIGTSSPAYKLDVVSPASESPIRLTSAAGTNIRFDTTRNFTVNRNWLVGCDYFSEGSFAIIPSTTLGGGTFSNPLYLITATGNHYWYSGATNTMRLDTSGNLGLGVTPSYKLHTASSAYQDNVFAIQQGTGQTVGNQNRIQFLDQNGTTAEINAYGGSYGTGYNLGLFIGSNYLNTSALGGTFNYSQNGYASRYCQVNGQHIWDTAPSGTAGNAISFTQAMTLDASGRLLIGGTTASNTILRADRSNSSVGDATVNSVGYFVNTYDNNTNGSTSYPVLSLERLGASGISNGSLFEIGLSRYSTATTDAYTQANFIVRDGNSSSRTTIATFSNNLISFSTASTERARITSGGFFKASDSGTYLDSAGSYHELRNTTDNGTVISTTNASQTANTLQVEATRNTTNNTFYSISYYNRGAAAYKFRVADSGDVTNTNGTYGTISDQKHKTDIVDAGSQWSDIKALRFRKFKMKDDPSGLVQLGVIAQEVELTSPGLVDEHADRDAEGNDLGTTTKSVKTSILLMKAAVALQEAMARIEALEAKVAALESN